MKIICIKPTMLVLLLCGVISRPAIAQMTSVGIHCSQISALGIDIAGQYTCVMIECGLAPAGDPAVREDAFTGCS